MSRISVLGVYREEQFSPGAVEVDRSILDEVLAHLEQQGIRVEAVRGEQLCDCPTRPYLVLSMAQSQATLSLLAEWERQGVRVINSVQSVLNCYREQLYPLLESGGIRIPGYRFVSVHDQAWKQALQTLPEDAYWVKRGDFHALSSSDVVQTQSGSEVIACVRSFFDRGVSHVAVQTHVLGKVVKFYGTKEWFFAADISVENGNLLQEQAHRAASALGLEVYGGDAVITRESGIVFIDFNDWPSFRSCRREAAAGIVARVIHWLEDEYKQGEQPVK
jgi:hypothetical protein